MSQFTEVLTFTVMQCPIQGCGVPYALEDGFRTVRQERGGRWYCPNGHELVFMETEVDRQRKRADAAERNLTAVRGDRDYQQRRAEHQARRAVSLKGVVTRTKRRIAAGKCPCCHKRFGDVAEHMTAEHPDYGSDES